MSKRAFSFTNFFQVAYVTRDIEGGIKRFQEQFGPHNFQMLVPEGGKSTQPGIEQVGIAYADDTQVEIIQVDPHRPSIWLEGVDDRPDGLRFHHLGFLIDDWEATLATLEQSGCKIALKQSWPGLLDCCYVDTREQLGHFCEYVRLDVHGREIFETIRERSTGSVARNA